MGDFNSIARITAGLRTLLASEFGFEIVEKPPLDTEATSSSKLSLWLYQITENEFVRNQPPALQPNGNGPANGATTQLRSPPLALNLFYLVTPLSDMAIRDQELLGKAMEVFHDNSLVFVSTGDSSLQELRISFCRLDLEELTRIWDALRQPYKLSVCYHVRVARIDSQRRQLRARVLEQVTGLQDVEK